MGSYISLHIGEIQVDDAKNHIGRDHSSLFVFPEDIKMEEVYYEEEDEKFYVEYCSRKLSSVKNRLDLLGYSLPQLKHYYNVLIKEFIDEGYIINLSFEDYAQMVSSMNLSVKVSPPNETSKYLSEYIELNILENESIKNNIPAECIDKEEEDDFYSPKNGFSDFLISIDPYVIIRLLAENRNNHELEIRWDYDEIVKGGWVKKEEVIHDLLPENKILIVTEGKTDSLIIMKAIEYLYPDISDFFEFIDMKENYPFTGTGNLHNFCLGLNKIKIQNKVIVIFDNDTAGNESINSVLSKIKSENILALCLPKYMDFETFKTIGPQGETTENINGKAVAIECFLDFSSISDEPKIRWTSYSEKLKQYQGALIKKDDYTRKFKETDLSQGKYDCAKLKYLIGYLIQEWANFQAQSIK